MRLWEWRLRSNRLTARPLLDRVDAVGIESTMILDRGNRSVGCFVGPDSVDGAISASGNAKVSAVALVGAVGGVVRSLEQRQIHVLARNVLDGRIARLAERQSILRIGHNASSGRHDDAMRVALNRDRMVRARNLDGFGFRSCII